MQPFLVVEVLLGNLGELSRCDGFVDLVEELRKRGSALLVTQSVVLGVSPCLELPLLLVRSRNTWYTWWPLERRGQSFDFWSTTTARSDFRCVERDEEETRDATQGTDPENESRELEMQLDGRHLACRMVYVVGAEAMVSIRMS